MRVLLADPKMLTAEINKSVCKGFAVIELLTVIAVVGILAAILIPVVSQMRSQASSSHSATNLRQIGAAVFLFANDHNGYLPGPITAGQSPRFRGDRENDQTGNLAYYIREYLDAGDVDTSTGYAKIFTYPAWERETESLNGISYFVHREPVDGFFPLGRRVSGDRELNTSSVNLAQFSSYDLGGERWISEADQENSAIPSAAGWFSRLPENAVHPMRNALHYDGSVQAHEIDD